MYFCNWHLLTQKISKINVILIKILDIKLSLIIIVYLSCDISITIKKIFIGSDKISCRYLMVIIFVLFFCEIGRPTYFVIKKKIYFI
jgi:hypothetical protein